MSPRGSTVRDIRTTSTTSATRPPACVRREPKRTRQPIGCAERAIFTAPVPARLVRVSTWPVQWPAVTAQRGATSVAPQTCRSSRGESMRWSEPS